ncbi:MAG: GLPGLI family protein [Saprospiraceae bacterium]|nr:GLPGLI family protein [Saprospiraceae bacterium]MBP7699543.1 GLPGLI family protein [Saprospiraceae bacterium]
MKQLLKTILVFFFITAHVVGLLAQYQGYIRYKTYNGQNNMTTYNKVYFNKEVSLFVRGDQEEKILENEPLRKKTVTYQYVEYYRDTKKKIGIKQKKLSDKKFVRTEFKEEAPIWTITNEKKKIKDYNCKKAVCQHPLFGEIVAWFTESIPVSVGTPSAWGLPGIVLEVSGGKGDYTDTVDSIVFEPVDKEKLYPTEGELLPEDKYASSKSDADSWLEKIEKAFNLGND